LLALCARSGAFLLPIVVSGAVALLVLDAFAGWTAAWRLVAWTCVIVGCTLAALACVPIAKRLSILGLLLALDVEFPTAAPSRVRLAAGASTLASAQFELARTARSDSTDELLTTRLATASMLGVFRTMAVRREDRVRVFSAVGVALCVAVAALLVVPDRAQSPQSPIAAGQHAETPRGNAATGTGVPSATVPTTPVGSNTPGNDQGSAPGAPPSVPETAPAAAPEAQPTEPESVSVAPDHDMSTSGAPSNASSSTGHAPEAVVAETPAPRHDAPLTPSANSGGNGTAVADFSSPDTGARAAGVLAPAALAPVAPAPATVAPASPAPASLVPASASVAPSTLAPTSASIAPASLAPATLAPAGVAPAVVTPTWSEPAASNDVVSPPSDEAANVGSPPVPAQSTDRSADGTLAEGEHPNTDVPSSVELPGTCHSSESRELSTPSGAVAAAN
jgi:hypothetical protein